MAAEHSDSILTDSILPSLQSPVRFSSLCKAHDTLLDALSQEQDLLSSRNNHQSNLLINIAARQADYLRALQICCKLLIGILGVKLPAASASSNNRLLEFTRPTKAANTGSLDTSLEKGKRQKVLMQTIQRSKILLEDLVKIVHASSSEPNPDFQESQHPILRSKHLDDEFCLVPHHGKTGLYTYKKSSSSSSSTRDDSDDSDDDDDSEILTFDRAALEQEERDLIQMASTPIPGEEEGGDPIILNGATENENDKTDYLQARLQREWSKEEIMEACQSRRKRQRTV